MRKLVVTNPNGVSITFDENLYGITNLTGLDVPDPILQSQKAPFQDGVTPIDQLLGPRMIVLQGTITVGNNYALIYQYRRALEIAINTKLGTHTMVYTNSYGTWYLSGRVASGPKFKNKNANEGNQQFQITFQCDDPYLYGAPQTIAAAPLTASYGTLNSGHTCLNARAIYGNGLFVAVPNGDIYTAVSTDGINWIAGSISNYNWRKPAYGNGLFVAIDGSTHTAVSTDGINWSYGTVNNHGWSAIIYGNGSFVAISASNIAISTDGINWTYSTITTQAWGSLTYGNGLFVALDASTHSAVSSDGGVTWSYGTTANHVWSDITYGNGSFVGIAANDYVTAVSTNGINWSYGNAVYALNWSSITFGNSLFIIIENTNIITRLGFSSDGISWSVVGGYTGKFWNSITYGNGLYIAVDGMTNYLDLRCFSITSIGDVSTPVIITVKVPGTNPVINCNDKYIRLVHAFNAGDIITIKTGFGNKSIVLQTSSGATPINIMQYRDLNSTMWELTPGVNNITVSNSNDPTTMQVGISYSEKYIGA